MCSPAAADPYSTIERSAVPYAARSCETRSSSVMRAMRYSSPGRRHHDRLEPPPLKPPPPPKPPNPPPPKPPPPPNPPPPHPPPPQPPPPNGKKIGTHPQPRRPRPFNAERMTKSRIIHTI